MWGLGEDCPRGRTTLPGDGRLVVVDLDIREAGEEDGEKEGEIAVGIADELEAGAPLVEVALEPDDLRFEPRVGDVELGVPRDGPEGRGRERGAESEVLLGRAVHARDLPGPGQRVVERRRKRGPSSPEYVG